MKRISMLRPVVGAHLGNPSGSSVGDVIEVDDSLVEAYVQAGWAVLVEEKKAESKTHPKVETATAPTGEVETATPPSPEHPVYGETHPPEHPGEQVTKRRPGRPRKE